MPRQQIEAHGDKWTEQLVSNGPFVLDTWKTRVELIAKANQHYWDANFVKLQQIVFLPIDDQDTGLQLFRQGEIHWQSSVPKGKLDDLIFDPAYYVSPYLGHLLLFFQLNAKSR